jgi:hypothetical protein
MSVNRVSKKKKINYSFSRLSDPAIKKGNVFVFGG